MAEALHQLAKQPAYQQHQQDFSDKGGRGQIGGRCGGQHRSHDDACDVMSKHLSEHRACKKLLSIVSLPSKEHQQRFSLPSTREINGGRRLILELGNFRMIDSETATPCRSLRAWRSICSENGCARVRSRTQNVTAIAS